MLKNLIKLLGLFLLLISCGTDQYTYSIEFTNDSDNTIKINSWEIDVESDSLYGIVDSFYIAPGDFLMITLAQEISNNTDNPLDQFIEDSILVTYEGEHTVTHTKENNDEIPNSLFDLDTYTKSVENIRYTKTSPDNYFIEYSFTFSQEDVDFARSIIDQ